MQVLNLDEAALVGGAEPTVSGVVTAVALGVAIATAPAWGSVVALISLAALGIKALE